MNSNFDLNLSPLNDDTEFLIDLNQTPTNDEGFTNEDDGFPLDNNPTDCNEYLTDINPGFSLLFYGLIGLSYNSKCLSIFLFFC